MPKKRVLIVEDEQTVALTLGEYLEELGHSSIAYAATFDEAMALAESGKFDVAWLDINLHGKTVYPIARVLRAKGARCAFMTGYSGHVVPSEHAHMPFLPKPFTLSNVEKVMLVLSDG